MAAGEKDFYFEAGTDEARNMLYTEPDGVTPVNLTGYTARMYLKRNCRSITPDLQLTTENGRLTITGALGKIVLNIPNSITKDLSGEYVYDLEIISGSGYVTRIVEGKVYISAEVTK